MRRELLLVEGDPGLRRQSEAATALWILVPWTNSRCIQSGVALRLPPHSKGNFRDLVK
ncbi:MAG: hypothetical protein ACRD6N_08805 [Pyrinomonadaceae bacterium]